MYPLVADRSEIYARPLPRVYAIFCLPFEYSAKTQPPQHTTTARAPLLLWAEEVEPWLTTQWQTEK